MKTYSTSQTPDISSDLLRSAYSSTPQALAAILISSLAIAFVLRDLLDNITIIIWLCSINLILVFRFYFYKQYLKYEHTHSVSFWRYAMYAGIIASGLAWGAASTWLFPENDIAHQLLLVFIIGGICSGAVASLSVLLNAFIIYLLLAMIPAIYQFTLLDSSVAQTMSIMLSVYSVFLIAVAKNFNQTIRESFVIRHEHIAANAIIEHQALYDPLTDLPNRRLLLEKIQHEIVSSERHKKIGAVLFLDLDFFKSINDSMGHLIGDELLKQIAKRLTSSLRKEDTVARLGGDEFIILLPSIGDNLNDAETNLNQFTNNLNALLANEFIIESHSIFITTSIGVSFFPFNNTTPEELLQKSDVAMYEAKSSGRNKTRLFVPEMQQHILKQIEIEKDIQQALIHDQFELYYQPLFDNNHKMFSVEALIRWIHPTKGMIPPDEFIDIAEKRGKIIDIGDWVLKKACSDLASISEHYNISMSINVSPRQFEESTFIEKLDLVLEYTKANANQIRLEITEGLVVKNIDSTIEKMNLLTSKGITFSLDDFGTGYSSLSHLKKLPVETLKIDKSFVMDIPDDKDDAVIVETILAMAEHLKIDVIAEGVETEQTLQFLKDNHCKKFQGYYFARPMPFNDLMEKLSDLS